MNYFQILIDIMLHLDKHLSHWVNILGLWSYILLFFVIFIETGIVILPFLPGDSLLFAAGAISAIPGSQLNHYVLIILFWLAAILGDSCNFFLGRTIGMKLVQHPFLGHFIKQKQLDDADKFFIEHGPLAIILSRFLPIIRTLTPFIASISGFSFHTFIILDTIAATLWTTIAVESGFYFGSVPFIRDHFSLVIIGILIITALPAIITGLRSYLIKKKETQMDKKNIEN